MRNIYTVAAVALIIVFGCTNCRVTEKSVSGTYQNSFDTITFYRNKSFTLTEVHFTNDHSRETKNHKGTWNVSNRTVNLNFNDTLGLNSFEKCVSLQVSRIIFRKTVIMRSWSCVNLMPAKPKFYRKMKQ